MFFAFAVAFCCYYQRERQVLVIQKVTNTEACAPANFRAVAVHVAVRLCG